MFFHPSESSVDNQTLLKRAGRAIYYCLMQLKNVAATPCRQPRALDDDDEVGKKEELYIMHTCTCSSSSFLSTNFLFDKNKSIYQIDSFIELISHTAYSWNNKCQKCAEMGLNGFIFKKINKKEREKKSWEPFRICLLNSTANSAQFHCKWAGLAMLETDNENLRQAEMFK